jgi:hypothetical protein
VPAVQEHAFVQLDPAIASWRLEMGIRKCPGTPLRNCMAEIISPHSIRWIAGGAKAGCAQARPAGAGNRYGFQMLPPRK